MHICLIVASSRSGSESRRVADWLEDRLKEKEIHTSILDLYEHQLPINEDLPNPEDQELKSTIRDWLGGADGYVVVTPEWSGSAAPAYKNMILHAGKTMAHKPALLVGVSSTRGGAYPISELRAGSYKNTRVNYIPEHLLFRYVKETLHGDEPANDNDAYMRKRAPWALDVLLEYAAALRQVRESGVPFHDDFPNGM